MRAKMDLYQERNPIANDLLDLEFLVQFLIAPTRHIILRVTPMH